MTDADNNLAQEHKKVLEARLVERARGGDQNAFAELVRILSPRLLSTARCIVHDMADAEDVVQSALFKAFRRIHGYRAEAAFSTWLTRITTNESIELLRRRRVDPVELADAADHAGEDALRWQPAPERTPEQIYASDEIERQIFQCVEQLPATYRAVLRLQVQDGLDYIEICGRLGLSHTTLKTRLCRGRRLLRDKLRWRGIITGSRVTNWPNSSHATN